MITDARCHAAAPGALATLCPRARTGSRRPRNVVDLPLLMLRKVVEAEDGGVLGAGLGLGGTGLGAHAPDLILAG